MVKWPSLTVAERAELHRSMDNPNFVMGVNFLMVVTIIVLCSLFYALFKPNPAVLTVGFLLIATLTRSLAAVFTSDLGYKSVVGRIGANARPSPKPAAPAAAAKLASTGATRLMLSLEAELAAAYDNKDEGKAAGVTRTAARLLSSTEDL